MPLNSIKNNKHITESIQSATKTQFLITMISAAASVLSKPIAITPGIAIPANDPHYAPNPITEVAVAFSVSLNHASTTILSPLNTIGPAHVKMVLATNRIQKLLFR